jgi:hypothetical protein
MLERHLALFRSLKRNKVEYLIIGGIACGIYGSPRATKDLDIMIRPTLKNANRLLAALKASGFGTAYLTTPEKILANEINIFEDVMRLDVLTKAKGLIFNTAWQKRQVKPLGRVVKINVVSLPDLINSKRASRRLIDKEDLKILRKIKRFK